MSEVSTKFLRVTSKQQPSKKADSKSHFEFFVFELAARKEKRTTTKAKFEREQRCREESASFVESGRKHNCKSGVGKQRKNLRAARKSRQTSKHVSITTLKKEPSVEGKSKPWRVQDSRSETIEKRKRTTSTHRALFCLVFGLLLSTISSTLRVPFFIPILECNVVEVAIGFLSSPRSSFAFRSTPNRFVAGSGRKADGKLKRSLLSLSSRSILLRDFPAATSFLSCGVAAKQQQQEQVVWDSWAASSFPSWFVERGERVRSFERNNFFGGAGEIKKIRKIPRLLEICYIRQEEKPFHTKRV